MNVPLHKKQQIDKLIEIIGGEFEHEIVPRNIESYSLPLSCFPNVEKKISIDGGSIYYGWRVHFGQFITEAERHAVWSDEDDNLTCITPDNNNSSSESIIFIPDNRAVMPDEQIDNIRINISGRKIVNDWIEICEFIGSIYRNNTNRIDDYRIEIPSEIKPILSELELIRDYLLGLIKKNIKQNNPTCFCEEGYTSGRGFSECHGAVAKKIMLEFKNTYL